MIKINKVIELDNLEENNLLNVKKLYMGKIEVHQMKKIYKMENLVEIFLRENRIDVELLNLKNIKHFLTITRLKSLMSLSIQHSRNRI